MQIVNDFSRKFTCGNSVAKIIFGDGRESEGFTYEQYRDLLFRHTFIPVFDYVQIHILIAYCYGALPFSRDEKQSEFRCMIREIGTDEWQLWFSS